VKSNIWRWTWDKEVADTAQKEWAAASRLYQQISTTVQALSTIATPSATTTSAAPYRRSRRAYSLRSS
jgi:hypothetical protein